MALLLAGYDCNKDKLILKSSSVLLIWFNYFVEKLKFKNN